MTGFTRREFGWRTRTKYLEVAKQSLDRWANIACFHAQQGSEKALKAALITHGSNGVRTHIASELVSELTAVGAFVPPDVAGAAHSLDRYNADGGVSPVTVSDTRDVVRALDDARKVYGYAADVIGREAAAF